MISTLCIKYLHLDAGYVCRSLFSKHVRSSFFSNLWHLSDARRSFFFFLLAGVSSHIFLSPKDTHAVLRLYAVDAQRGALGLAQGELTSYLEPCCLLLQALTWDLLYLTLRRTNWRYFSIIKCFVSPPEVITTRCRFGTPIYTSACRIDAKKWHSPFILDR